MGSLNTEEFKYLNKRLKKASGIMAKFKKYDLMAERVGIQLRMFRNELKAINLRIDRLEQRFKYTKGGEASGEGRRRH